MTIKDESELFWREWRDTLLVQLEGKLSAINTKGYPIIPRRKNFFAIFLQVKSSSISTPDILLEVIRTIKERGNFDKKYDDIATMGHRIGMLENSAGLKQFLQDMQRMMQDGQILFTSLEIPAVIEPARRANPVFRSLQLQQSDLIGPFFCPLRIKADTLQNQAAAVNWQSEIIYHQDDNNYFAVLRPIEFG